MGSARRFLSAIFGARIELPPELIERYPELADARFRTGGFPLRVGGWALGASRVAGITLGRTIFLDGRSALDPALLLHELRHVHQFRHEKGFPVRYLWQSIRRGYMNNPYEVDARRFAAVRLRGGAAEGPTSKRGSS